MWRNFGTFAAAELDLTEDDYEELAQWELNGREIKNVLSCSKVLSAENGEGNSLETIRQVLSLVTDSSKVL